VPNPKRPASGLRVLLLVAWLSAPPSAQPGTIEEIHVQGLSRMSRQSFLLALGIQVGDPYDLRQIRQRFGRAWREVPVFEDLSIEAEDGPQGGKVLVIKVKERPVLSGVSYDESSVVTRTEIENRYKERRIELRLGKPLDQGAVYFAEAAIRDLLGEKGFLDARVRAEVREVTATTRAVHFHLSPGGKTRIRRIEFTGNAVHSDRRLKRQLKLTAERKWYWPWSSKNLYHPIKWDQDSGTIRKLYQNGGYLDVELRSPIVEVRQTKPKKQKKRGGSGAEAAPAGPPPAPDREVGPPAKERGERAEPGRRSKQQTGARKRAGKNGGKKPKPEPVPKRWVFLTVPVTEGPQYRLGEITIEGNEVFPDDVLRRQIVLAEGAIVNHALLELGTDRMTRLYEDRGYLYASVVRRIDRRAEGLLADVRIEIEEDRPYYVGRIEFRGNSQTQDRVLRRELQLAEGELFGRTKLEVSKAKVNQLGYFQVRGEPVIEPIADEQNVKITLSGEEQGRNEIQIGGGYSGLEGAFFNGVYSTRNFLGRGQVLSAALQIGGRSSRYQISLQEPWFLGRPYLLGVSLYRRSIDFGSNLESTSSGIGVVVGKRVGRYSRVNLGYNFQSVTSESFIPSSVTVPGQPIGTARVQTRNDISSLTPAFSFSTINNPYRPTRGTQWNLSTQVAGGGLGGDTSFLKPLVSYTSYRRGFGRLLLALHGELGLVRDFGGGSQVTGSEIEGIPRFERFWLGGDTLGPRVFETRSITPRRYVVVDDRGRVLDVLGDPREQPARDFVTSGGIPVAIEVGGDRMVLVQSELVRPLNEQADLALFLDAGDALFEDTALDLRTIRVSTGIELRFHLPIFPVPLRLIYGWPIREFEGDDTSNFTFSIGRSF